jgi:putative nucleotidyltransferase with HDIG domain
MGSESGDAIRTAGRRARLQGAGIVAHDDAVLAGLAQVEGLYQQFLVRCADQSSVLLETRMQLADARDTIRALGEELTASRRQGEEERARAERQRERADQLSAILKDIHRSLFSGNIYELILRACLTITGGTRGLYLTVRGEDALQVRAAIDVNGYPQAPPSAFLRSLCRQVRDAQDTLVCNTEADLAALPDSAGAGERFRNCVVTPVALLKNFDGIIVVADKPHGDFVEDDVETLLSVGDQATVAVENTHLRRELQQAYISTVSTLADAMEAKDPYTHGHCEQVSRYARLIAARLELPDHERSVVCYAALLHDIGKIGISDGVLNKPGILLDEERALMRAHVQVGRDLLRHVPALSPVAEVVLRHHEWFDGTGYPDGVAGAAIPIAARIVGAVDAYCAMITKRSYKEAFSEEEARAELRRCAGSQFDPAIVDAFLAILDDPASRDWDDDDDAACGVLPGFGHIRDFQRAIL